MRCQPKGVDALAPSLFAGESLVQDPSGNQLHGFMQTLWMLIQKLDYDSRELVISNLFGNASNKLHV
jgi:hypothetical protein